MDDNAAHYQRGLAFYAGILHGFFTSWGALRQPWMDFIQRMGREGRKPSDYDLFVHHGSALIALQVKVQSLAPMKEAEDARTILLSLMQSQIDVLHAAMTNSEQHSQLLADTTEEAQIFLVAWERLCVLAGLPDDPIDE